MSVEFDNQGQSFATHHNQMHMQFGVIMTDGHVKKRQCITVKFLATKQTMLCENNCQEEKTSCQLESRMVYVKKCIFKHNQLKPVLTKQWHRHFTMGNETLIPTTKIL